MQHWKGLLVSHTMSTPLVQKCSWGYTGATANFGRSIMASQPDGRDEIWRIDFSQLGLRDVDKTMSEESKDATA